MKKIRLLQIAVYIAFAALFLQDAAADAYKGFMEGFKDAQTEKSDQSGTLVSNVLIDGKSMAYFKNGGLKLNDNYSLENADVSADLRVKQLADNPIWMSVCEIILVLGILYLLVKMAWIINSIILNIYRGTMFRNEAVKLLREMGALLIIYFIADYLFQQLSYAENTRAGAPFKLINTSSFNFQVLIFGLLILAIANAFKEAAQLKEEQELTI